jgi:hypothetical protein
LQVLQAKATVLQTQTRLLQYALEQNNLQQHSKLVLVQIFIFKDDEDVDVDSYQQLA